MRSTIAYELSGCRFQMTKSASLPGSSEPILSSIAIALAALIVTVLSAWISLRPVRSSLPASQFIRVEISELSECSDVTTPANP